MLTPRSKTEFTRRTIDASNAFVNPDVNYPDGSLDADVIEDLIVNYAGTLTISGGTTDGLPTSYNPASYLTRLYMSVVGLPIPELLNITMKDLNVLTMCAQRNMESDPDEEPVLSGAAGAVNFRAGYRIPFGALDMRNGDQYFLDIPSLIKAGAQSVNLRAQFGGVEHLVSNYDLTNTLVGDRTRAITAATMKLDRTTYTTDGRYSDLKDKLLLSRQSMADIALPTANPYYDVPILKNPAYLRRLGIYTYRRLTDGTEVGDDSIITSDMIVRLLVGSTDTPIEVSARFLRAEALRRFRRPLPPGYMVIDLCPNGDPATLKQWNLAALPQVKLRFENAAVTGAYVRVFLEEHIPMG